MNTKKLKQLVLDLAIHGKLVPQDPNDEPASELLKRIQEEKAKTAKGKKTSISSDNLDEVPFEVPSGWVWRRLGDVISVKSGDGIKVRDTDGDKYPIYGGNGINGFHNSFNVESQTLLIGRVGFYCGSVHKTISKSWVTDNALIVSHEVNAFCIDFLYRLLTWMNLGSTSNSTAQPVVSGKGILPLPIPLPPLSEQKRIVSAIEKWFAVIDQLESNEADLRKSIEQTKKKVLDLAIHGKLVEQDEKDEPASELLKRIKEEKAKTAKGKKAIADVEIDEVPFELPKGWVWTNIESAFIINPKNECDDNVMAGFVPMANVCDNFSNSFSYEPKQWGLIKKGFVHFKNGDVAVAKISPCMENRKSVVFHDLPNGIGAGTTELNIFRSEIDSLYSLIFFKSEYFINHCKSTFAGTVGQQRVDKEVLLSMPFPLPPLAEQKRIVAKVEEVMGALDKMVEMMG